MIESLRFLGDVPRVDGQLAVARAFGDKNLKVHLTSYPDILEMELNDSDEVLILASDGLWKVRGIFYNVSKSLV
jgi:protein phosphatase 1L